MYGDAKVLAINGKRLLVRGISIAQGQVHFGLVILPAKLGRAAALPTGAACAATKQGFKKVGEIPFAKLFGKRLTATTKTTAAKAVCLFFLPLLFNLLGMLPVLAVLVVFFSLLGIAQH